MHFGDIRNFPPELLDGVDAVVHLAAISNDPMGKEFEGVTEAINEKASVALAQMAEQRGVGTFRLCVQLQHLWRRRRAAHVARATRSIRSPPMHDPKSRWKTRCARAMPDEMTVTCLRFATACGMSDRLRLDLVLNDFVAGALATGEITVLSDGTPWRPLIDVADMARAIEWAIGRSPTTAAGFCGQCRQQGRQLSGSGAGRSRGR